MASLAPATFVASNANQKIVILGAPGAAVPVAGGGAGPSIMIDHAAAAASQQLERSAQAAFNNVANLVGGGGNAPAGSGAIVTNHPHERLLATLLEQHRQRYGNLPTPQELAPVMAATSTADPATVVATFSALSNQVATRAPAASGTAPAASALGGGMLAPTITPVTSAAPAVGTPAVFNPPVFEIPQPTPAEPPRAETAQPPVAEPEADPEPEVEEAIPEISGEGPPPPGTPGPGTHADPVPESGTPAPDEGVPAGGPADTNETPGTPAPVNPAALPPPGPQARSAQENATAVASVADEFEIDPVLAVAIMLAASGGDNRLDANGRMGVFGLDSDGLIAEAGLTDEDPFDPFLNARIALGALAPELRERADEPPNAVAAEVLSVDAAAIDAQLAQAGALLTAA